MKICVTQIQSARATSAINIQKHIHWIEFAIDQNAALIVFPELSLTGYEPELASQLAIEPDSETLNVFEKISKAHDLTITLGLPVKTAYGIQIGMGIFQPDGSRQIYAKQELHADEMPYFVAGDRQSIVTIGNRKIAPAICFEALQAEHAARAFELGAQLYLVSAAKCARGVKKALIHFPRMAKEFSMPVLFSNAAGPCDNFISAGNSAAWDEHGNLAGQLGAENEGAILYDMVSGKASVSY